MSLYEQASVGLFNFLKKLLPGDALDSMTPDDAVNVATALLLGSILYTIAMIKYDSIMWGLNRTWRTIRSETKRSIEFTYSGNWKIRMNQDSRNNILHSAIIMALKKDSVGVGELPIAGFSLQKAVLTTQKRHEWDTSSDDDSDEDIVKSHNTEGEKKKESSTKICPFVPVSENVKLKNGLWCTYVVRDQHAEHPRKVIRTFTFTAYGRDGQKRIDDFIHTAYDEYLEVLKLSEDSGRYLYQMQLQKAGGDGGGGGDDEEEEGGGDGDVDVSGLHMFKKYALTDAKAFQTLFFPRKKEVLQLVDDFVERKGKFGIKGFPKKLGLLLHGPPGTGKTSFVKALAAHTKRHIVSIPLAKIETNQELYDIFFDLVFPTPDDDGIVQRMKFKDVIFLLEDIDATSDVVKSRKALAKKQAALAAAVAAAKKAAEAGDGQSKASDDGEGNDEEEKEEEEEGEAPGLATTTLERNESRHFSEMAAYATNSKHFPSRHATLLSTQEEADAMAAVEEEMMAEAGAADEGGFMDVGALGVALGSTLKSTADKLDLAGLLNVLDGVVDTPDRLLVMTTNHPEDLDAALIRPGRINFKLEMPYMGDEAIVEMAAHHYGAALPKLGESSAAWKPEPLKPADEKALRELLAAKRKSQQGLTIAGAEVEQFCAECDSLEEFMEELQEYPRLGPDLIY